MAQIVAYVLYFEQYIIRDTAASNCQIDMFAGFSKAVLDFGLFAGLSVSGLHGPLRSWRERQLAKIFASGQTLRLQFPKEDLGFVYSSKGVAVCPESPLSPQSPQVQNPELGVSGSDGTAANTKGRSHRQGSGSVGGSDRQYRPSCSPGGRLPHCTLQPLKPGQNQERNTLRLLRADTCLCT